MSNNIHEQNDYKNGMTHRIKIMLSGIAIINNGYFDNINNYYLK